jgi:hypothetical protein
MFRGGARSGARLTGVRVTAARRQGRSLWVNAAIASAAARRSGPGVVVFVETTHWNGLEPNKTLMPFAASAASAIYSTVTGPGAAPQASSDGPVLAWNAPSLDFHGKAPP